MPDRNIGFTAKIPIDSGIFSNQCVLLTSRCIVQIHLTPRRCKDLFTAGKKGDRVTCPISPFRKASG